MGELSSALAVETYITTVSAHCVSIKIGFGRVGFEGEKKTSGNENQRQFLTFDAFQPARHLREWRALSTPYFTLPSYLLLEMAKDGFQTAFFFPSIPPITFSFSPSIINSENSKAVFTRRLMGGRGLPGVYGVSGGYSPINS